MRVLCVERDFLALRHMKRELPKIIPEAEIRFCCDPDDALALAGNTGCDILLTGIDMGTARNEGITLARKVQAINPRVNIIFVTVCDEREYARDLVSLRVSGYVRKPYEPQQLAAEFAHLLYAAG